MAGPLDVAIHLTATNGVSSILAVISKDVLGLHGNVEKLQKGFAALKPAIVGAAAVLVGSGMLAGVTHLVEKGNELVKIQRDMAQAGVTATQVQTAYAEAWKLTGRYQNLSAVEIMKMANDARMTFGSQDKATEHLQPYVQMASFLKSYEGGKHAGADTTLMAEVNAAMKSGELAGKITPEEMTEHVKQLTAMKVAYGDGLKISTYLAAQRTGGVALRNTSDEFRYGMFPAMVQEQGSSAGVMLMTAFNKIVAGTGNRTKSLEHMSEIGLLNKDQLDYDKVGRIKGLKNPDAIKGSTDAAMNFGNWVMTSLKPLLDKQTAGLDPTHANIKESQLISAMFPDRNAAKAITEVIQQYTKFQKDAEQMLSARKAMDADSYNAGSWDYQTQAFRTQWGNLVTALGAPSVATATAMLAKFNGALTEVASWTAAHPDFAKNIVGGIAVLGAALVGFGAIMVGGAVVAAIGFVGPITAGIAAVAAVMVGLGTALVAFKPEAAKAAFNYIAQMGAQMIAGMNQAFAGLSKGTMAGVVEAIVGIGRIFNAQLLGLPGMVASGIASAVAGIGSAISGAISNIGAGLTGAGGQGRGHAPVGQWPHAGQQHSMAAPIPSRSKVAVIEFNHTTNLDGRKVAQNQSRHLATLAEHPNSIGAMDSYGTHAGPGTDLPAWG